MSYSHRDRRMHRQVWRWTALLFMATTLGIAVTAALPPGGWGLGALAGLAVLGAAYLARSERVVRQYVRDLESVRRGAATPGWVTAEVASEVGLEGRPTGPTRASPNVRRPRGPETARSPDYRGA